MPASAALRAAAISIACCALLSPSARANPAVTRVDPLVPFALAGPDVLVARTKGRRLRLLAYPVKGGPAVERFRFTVPRGMTPEPRLGASSGAVGLVVATGDGRGLLATGRPFAGAQNGPLAPVGPLVRRSASAFMPVGFDPAGGGMVLMGLRRSPRARQLTVYEPGAAPVAVVLPEDAFDVDFAGELVAYVVNTPDGGFSQRLVVREWRSGVVRWSSVIPEGVEAFDLRPDGAVVIEPIGEGIMKFEPGGSPMTRVSRDGATPVFAGDAIVFVRGDRLEGPMRMVLAEAGRRPRTFAPPSARIADLVADGQRVAWRQNGCLLVADIADPPGPRLPPGPCARSELLLGDASGEVKVGSDRVVPIVLRCLTGPPPGCRGSVTLSVLEGLSGPESERVSFSIRSGASRRIRIRLKVRAYAALVREETKPDGDGAVFVIGTTIDRAGRRSRLLAGYSIELR